MNLSLSLSHTHTHAHTHTHTRTHTYTHAHTRTHLQEEEIKNSMNADRRCAYLEKKLQGVEDELSRQEKARQGVEGLQKAYLEQPDFTDDKGADDVARQLLEVGGINWSE